jgi:hypothetical protein
MLKGLHLRSSKFLNKKDPIDNAILQLIKKDILKISIVKLNSKNI